MLDYPELFTETEEERTNTAQNLTYEKLLEARESLPNTKIAQEIWFIDMTSAMWRLKRRYPEETYEAYSFLTKRNNFTLGGIKILEQSSYRAKQQLPLQVRLDRLFVYVSGIWVYYGPRDYCLLEDVKE